MAKVRGSIQDKLVVKSHRPWRGVVSFLVLLLIGAVLGAGGFVSGLYYEATMQAIGPSERATLRAVEQQVMTLERDRIVDKVAVESSRKAIKEMEEQLHRMGKEIAFYKSVMSPESDVKGLHVQGLDISRGAQANEYTISWVMTQVGRNDAFLAGATSLRLVGSTAGVPGVLKMSDVAEQKGKVKFKLRYFQNVSMDIVVPPEFVVEKIEIAAQTDGKKPQSITREFDWIIQEALVDVRQ
jgi:hypothetical protein